MHSSNKKNNTENESKNAGLLGTLPRELISDGISNFLSVPDMRKLQQTCRFFKHHEKLNEKINKESAQWKVFAKGSETYFMAGNGHVCTLGGKAHENPAPIYLSNKKPIAKVIPKDGYVFLVDVDGNYHVSTTNSTNWFYSAIRSATPFSLPNGKSITDIVCGWETSFIRDTDGNWHACGNTNEGQLGISIPMDMYNKIENIPTLVSLPNKKPIKRVVTAFRNTFFQDESGQWFGCGQPREGIFGVKSGNIYRPIPLNLPDNISVIDDIVGGYLHSFIRDDQGNWYGCGQNSNGQLGIAETKDGTESIYPLPHLPSHKPIVEIIAGGQHTFFRDTDDNWYGSGWNYFGQLGIGHRNDNNIFEPKLIILPNNERIAKVIAAQNHTFFLDTKNHWYGTGRNANRELGFKEKDNVYIPTPIDFSELEAEIKLSKEKTDVPDQMKYSL